MDNKVRVMKLDGEKEIIEENIEMARMMSLEDWRRFRSWCNYYEIRQKMSVVKWRYEKNRLLRKWLWLDGRLMDNG